MRPAHWGRCALATVVYGGYLRAGDSQRAFASAARISQKPMATVHT